MVCFVPVDDGQLVSKGFFSFTGGLKQFVRFINNQPLHILETDRLTINHVDESIRGRDQNVQLLAADLLGAFSCFIDDKRS